MCRSVPQIPTAPIRINTSRGPTAGVSISRTANAATSSRTRAFMRSFPPLPEQSSGGYERLDTITRGGFRDLAPGDVVHRNSLPLPQSALPLFGLTRNEDFRKSFCQFTAFGILHQLLDVLAEALAVAELHRVQQNRGKAVPYPLCRGTAAS